MAHEIHIRFRPLLIIVINFFIIGGIVLQFNDARWGLVDTIRLLTITYVLYTTIYVFPLVRFIVSDAGIRIRHPHLLPLFFFKFVDFNYSWMQVVNVGDLLPRWIPVRIIGIAIDTSRGRRFIVLGSLVTKSRAALSRLSERVHPDVLEPGVLS